MARSVVVTGASSGIGRATVLHLAAAGWQVWAGVRAASDGDQLVHDSAGRVAPLLLDVTNARSVEEAAAVVARAVGADGLSALVNNAGVTGSGPVEYLALEEWRRVLEVNVLGQLAMTRAFLPLLRRGRGRIVFVGSVLGRVSMPLGGPYQASKHALAAIARSLRQELSSSGLEVVLLEPGAIRTPIWDKNLQAIEQLPVEARRHYGPFLQAGRRWSEEGRRDGIPPERVASVIESALTSARPRPRYLVGRDALMFAALDRLLPDRLLDHVIARRSAAPHARGFRGARGVLEFEPPVPREKPVPWRQARRITRQERATSRRDAGTG